MRKPTKPDTVLPTNDAPDETLTDDGGSGLFDACKSRFAPPEFDVECDARHTVWVRRSDGVRSVGLPPWQIGRHSVDEILERTAKKLGSSGARR